MWYAAHGLNTQTYQMTELTNPYQALVEHHPALPPRTHHYWRLNSLWDPVLLRERAQENRQLAEETSDSDYLAYLRKWLETEGFPLETASTNTIGIDDLDSALNHRKLIKVEIRALPKKAKKKRARLLEEVPCTELEIPDPTHQRALALMGCTEPQFTGKSVLSKCMRAVMKYIYTQHLQSQTDRTLFRLDDNLRLLLGLPKDREECSYYDYKGQLLKTIVSS